MGSMSGAEIALGVTFFVAIAATEALFHLRWPKHSLTLWYAFRTTGGAVLILVAAAMAYAEANKEASRVLALGVALALIAAVLWVAGTSSEREGSNRTPWDK